MLLELIRVDISTPSWWWLFALNNLFFTCVVEEVFFRAYLQTKLSKQFNRYIGLCIASLWFGLAHFSGGLTYIVIATVAGFLYGVVYLRTGKIAHAILAHFMHLMFFTYPMLKA